MSADHDDLDECRAALLELRGRVRRWRKWIIAALSASALAVGGAARAVYAAGQKSGYHDAKLENLMRENDELRRRARRDWRDERRKDE